MKTTRKIFKRMLPSKVLNFFQCLRGGHGLKLPVHAKLSYSQEGEDMVLKRLFYGVTFGFYVDVGAHHPSRFSNTKLFYDSGWRGINIDPLPGTKELFDQERPNDKNIEVGISSENRELTYFMFNEPALNTFDPKEAKRKDGLKTFKLIEQRSIKTMPLSQVLDQNMESGQVIDFMTIDVEGLDMEVIDSNDWNKFRPKIILIEDLDEAPLMSLIEKSLLFKKMISLNYELISKTRKTLFFKDVRS